MGVTDAAATGLLPRVFVPYRRLHPGIEVAVAEGHWALALELSENFASEMAAKMVAMKSATDNAGEIIDKLFEVAAGL